MRGLRRSDRGLRDASPAPPADLVLAGALALLAVLAAEALPGSLLLLRALLALPLALALPGYAVTAVLFAPEELRTAERLLLSIALSIAATILSALLLAVLGVHLDLLPWSLVLAAVTLAAAAVAAARGHGRSLPRPRVALRASEAGALIGAALLLSAAGAVGFTPLSAPRGTHGQTALWIAPARGGAAVCVGISSDQLRTTSYALALSVRNVRISIGPVRLRPGATFSRRVAVGPGRPTVSARLSGAGAAGVTPVVLHSPWRVPASGC